MTPLLSSNKTHTDGQKCYYLHPLGGQPLRRRFYIFKTISFCADKGTTTIIFPNPEPSEKTTQDRETPVRSQGYHDNSLPPTTQHSKKHKDGGKGAYPLCSHWSLPCAELLLFPPIYRSVGVIVPGSVPGNSSVCSESPVMTTEGS